MLLSDVNEQGGSSTALAETSASSDTTAETTSTPTTGEDGLNAVLAAAAGLASSSDAKKSEILEEDKTKATATETEKTEDKSAEKEEAEESKETEEDKTEETTNEEEEAKEPVPYERFSELNTQKLELEQKLQAAQPLAEAQQGIIDYCQENSVTPEQFNYWLSVAATASTDPLKALEMLTPVTEALKAYSGEKLPPDLEEKVKNQEISLEMAKRLVKAEQGQKIIQNKTKLTEQQRQVKQQQELANSYRTSLQSFIETKAKTDPDFKPKTAGQPDGLFEMFVAVLSHNASTAKVQSAADLVKLASDTYTSLKTSFRKLGGSGNKNGSGKQLRSNQSTSKKPAPPKSLDEAMARATAKYVPAGA